MLDDEEFNKFVEGLQRLLKSLKKKSKTRLVLKSLKKKSKTRLVNIKEGKR